MNKLFKLLISIGFVTLFLVGCQTTSRVSDDIERIEVIFLEDDKDRLILTELDNLNSFQDVLDQAEAVEGVVNMTDPLYRVEIVYTSEETNQYHLWTLDPDLEGSLVKGEDTHTLYTMPKDMTAILQDLIEGE